MRNPELLGAYKDLKTNKIVNPAAQKAQEQVAPEGQAPEES